MRNRVDVFTMTDLERGKGESLKREEGQALVVAPPYWLLSVELHDVVERLNINLSLKTRPFMG